MTSFSAFSARLKSAEAKKLKFFNFYSIFSKNFDSKNFRFFPNFPTPLRNFAGGSWARNSLPLAPARSRCPRGGAVEGSFAPPRSSLFCLGRDRDASHRSAWSSEFRSWPASNYSSSPPASDPVAGTSWARLPGAADPSPQNFRSKELKSEKFERKRKFLAVWGKIYQKIRFEVFHGNDFGSS